MRRTTAIIAGALVLAFTTPASVQGQETEATVTNVAPAVTSVTPPGSPVTPTAGGTTGIAVTTTVSDENGYNDIASVAIRITDPSGAEFASENAPTQTTANGASATYSANFTLQFYDAPGTYNVTVTVQDAAGLNATSSPATFTYAQLVALNLGQNTLGFGTSLTPGATSDVVPLTVRNIGNVAIDTDLSGTNLEQVNGDASIPVTRVQYDTTSGLTGATSLTTTPATLSTFDLAPGASSTQDLYWQLNVPSANEQQIPAGQYVGTTTVSARGG